MYRLLFAVLAGLVATQVWVPAHASTIDYTLTFTASSPYAADTGGSGTFELNGPINTNGNRTYSLTELSMTVDGLNFSLTQDPSATVSFNNGVFSGLSFDGTDVTGLFMFDTLDTSGTSYDLVKVSSVGRFRRAASQRLTRRPRRRCRPQSYYLVASSYS